MDKFIKENQRPGERYAGVIVTKGVPSHHLFLISGFAKLKTWTEAKKWAEFVDGELPTCREMSLLAANISDVFSKNEWYWSSQKADTATAYIHFFGTGGFNTSDKLKHHSAIAIRRLEI